MTLFNKSFFGHPVLCLFTVVRALPNWPPRFVAHTSWNTKVSLATSPVTTVHNTPLPFRPQNVQPSILNYIVPSGVSCWYASLCRFTMLLWISFALEVHTPLPKVSIVLCHRDQLASGRSPPTLGNDHSCVLLQDTVVRDMNHLSQPTSHRQRTREMMQLLDESSCRLKVTQSSYSTSSQKLSRSACLRSLNNTLSFPGCYNSCWDWQHW